MYNHLRPILRTNNLEETIDFYTTILGFDLDEKNEEWQWASLSKDNVGIMLGKPLDNENIQFSGSFYINVNEVDKLWNELKTKTKICYEIENFPWEMCEFAVYDNNGYVIQFGENL